MIDVAVLLDSGAETQVVSRTLLQKLGILPKSSYQTGDYLMEMRMEDPIQIVLADEKDSFSADSSVTIPRLILPFVHGQVVLDNIEVAVVDKGFDNCDDIILGCPVLHYLKALPSNVLEKYAVHEKVFD